MELRFSRFYLKLSNGLRNWQIIYWFHVTLRLGNKDNIILICSHLLSTVICSQFSFPSVKQLVMFICADNSLQQYQKSSHQWLLHILQFSGHNIKKSFGKFMEPLIWSDPFGFNKVEWKVSVPNVELWTWCFIYRHAQQNLIMYVLSKLLVDCGKHWCVFIQGGLGPRVHNVNKNHQISKVSDIGRGFSKEKNFI